MIHAPNVEPAANKVGRLMLMVVKKAAKMGRQPPAPG